MPLDKDQIRQVLNELDSLDIRIQAVEEFLKRLEVEGAGETTFRTKAKGESSYATFNFKLPVDEIKRYAVDRLAELAVKRESTANRLKETVIQ